MKLTVMGRKLIEPSIMPQFFSKILKEPEVHVFITLITKCIKFLNNRCIHEQVVQNYTCKPCTANLFTV